MPQPDRQVYSAIYGTMTDLPIRGHGSPAITASTHLASMAYREPQMPPTYPAQEAERRLGRMQQAIYGYSAVKGSRRVGHRVN